MEDDIGGDINALRFHIFGNAAGRVEFSCGVGHETDEVMKKRNVADAVALNDILQHDGIVGCKYVDFISYTQQK